jgi:superfamily II DNA or RNA helicase
MLKENPSQQIMILAHNKNLLKYLYDAISFRNMTTVGYYIGGMKEPALKESESKQIIIATYSMAAEALDIRTLTTLIMATPKTDIEQAVGRILREKHSQPVVVDIIDNHEIFARQWVKRKKFYKAQNYKIIECSNENYSPNTENWKTIMEPKLVTTNINACKKDNTSLIKNNKDELQKNELPKGKCFINIKK